MDVAALISRKTITLSRNFHMSTSIVRKDTLFVQMMRSVLSYAATFEEEYETPSLHVRTSDIASNIFRSNFF